MKPVVHQSFGDVEGGDPVLALQVPGAEHELMHAEPVERKLVRVLQPRDDVVRVQHRRLRHLAEPRAIRANVRVRAHEHAERAGVPTDLADRLRAIVVELERVALADHRRDRQEGLEKVAHDDRAAAGAAASVRLRERLVQIDVHDVETHVTGTRDAADRVEVRAVVVQERTGVVEDLLDVRDVLVEQP